MCHRIAGGLPRTKGGQRLRNCQAPMSLVTPVTRNGRYKGCALRAAVVEHASAAAFFHAPNKTAHAERGLQVQRIKIQAGAAFERRRVAGGVQLNWGARAASSQRSTTCSAHMTCLPRRNGAGKRLARTSFSRVRSETHRRSHTAILVMSWVEEFCMAGRSIKVETPCSQPVYPTPF